MYSLEKLLPNDQNTTPDDLLDLFLQYVDSEGLELYPAQEEAILSLYDGQNVILNTPTGSGKSLVALATHFLSLARGNCSYYTCPVKALVNEKFLSLCRTFGPKHVGMLTGDASVNPEAPIICCTAEILANMALRQGDQTLVQDVIMDEFHFYSDSQRGAAWQIPLLTMPYSRFLLMSATIGDSQPFKKYLDDLTSKKTSIIKETKRPVPLDFHYKENTLYSAIDDLLNENKAPIYLVNFTQKECAEYANNLISLNVSSKENKKEITLELKNVRFNSPYGKELKRVLSYGIGIHHAGMLPKYRLTVEKLTQKGLLKVICGTDTLGVGVNVPIRTVLFNKLCKYDGQKVGVLTIREFQQISGRAGRKGYDDFGTVVALAPEHFVENKILEHKCDGDPKKIKKLKRKPPPSRGFVHWDEKTFHKLKDSEPESLKSRFAVNHGMLLNVLSRPNDGCQSMRDIIKNCHESDIVKARNKKMSFKLLRSLLERDLIEFVDNPEKGGKKIQVKIELQDEFSLYQELAIWLIDIIPSISMEEPEYELIILSLVEAICENPRVILLRQLDKLKGKKVAELKAEGVEYDQRMEILEELTYPKPMEDFIYGTFNTFLKTHPWLELENIKPKSIVREMYEESISFDEYIKKYGLQRSEGILLRYISQVYKILIQSVPDTYHTDSLKELIVFLKAIIGQIDSSLLAEWEALGAPRTVQQLTEDTSLEQQTDITTNKHEFTILIRNSVFYFLRLLADSDFSALLEIIEPKKKDGETWFSRELDELMAPYYDDHEYICTDATARAPLHFNLKWDRDICKIEQIITDPQEYNDWSIQLSVDLEKSRSEQSVVLKLEHIGPIGI